MTLALGIDPGTATTGYGLVRLAHDGDLVAVNSAVPNPEGIFTPGVLECSQGQSRDLLMNTEVLDGPRLKNYFSQEM